MQKKSAFHVSARSRPRATLALHGRLLDAFMAGENFMRRTHWLLRAHQSEDREVRALCVSFAQTAHRAYLNDLKRALQPQLQPPVLRLLHGEERVPRTD